MVALQSAACSYDSCETDDDCAINEECILPGGSCALKASFCAHSETRPCQAGTHSRGTTRENYGVCNKGADPRGVGRVEVCVGGAWIANRTRFDEIRRNYVEQNYVAVALPRFDLAEEYTKFEALPKDKLDAIDLAIQRKDFVLCGSDEDNTDFYVPDVDVEWVSREICNGINDDCDPDPKNPDDINGLIDEDFIGQRIDPRQASTAATLCITGFADGDGNCLCTEPDSLGTCQRRGVQVCDQIVGADNQSTFRLGCSSVEVAPDPTRRSCNGLDDNCNGVIDEFLVSLPSISYEGLNTDNFNPQTNIWAAGLVGINTAPNHLFALERNARKLATETGINLLPKIDLHVLDTSGSIEQVKRQPDIQSTNKVDIFGLNPRLHVITPASDAVPAAVTKTDDAVLFYYGQIEFNCTNGLDDDGDGLIDCADVGECNSDQCGETNSGVASCRDNRDGDRDGLIDCADSECFGSDDCATSENCADRIDNNQNGLTDCADPICFKSPQCATSHFSKAELCGNGLDDDSDGLTDCLDPECCNVEACSSMPICRVESLCDSVSFPGLDGDGDGFIGCNDPDCCALPDCNGQGVCARTCTDQDCSDPFCEGTAACPTYATASECSANNCGGTDLGAVARCRVFPECHEDCKDGIDNNGDGLTDCADVRCINTPLCKRPTERSETCGPDIVANCNDPSCQGFNFPPTHPKYANTPYCLSTPIANDPCIETVGSETRCKADLFCQYNPSCLPCEYGGSACIRTECKSLPVCGGPLTTPPAPVPVCNTSLCGTDACAESIFCYSTCLTSGDCPSPELCHDHIDNNGDGLIDCEDVSACGYSVFCTQELFALVTPFSFNATSGTLTESPSSIATNDICISCGDDGVFQSTRVTDPTLGLARPKFKNRPTFFEVLPRRIGTADDFFVLYGREAQSGFRIYSARTQLTDNRVTTGTPQLARVVGTPFSGVLRQVRLSSVGTTSEVRLAVVEELLNENNIFGADRLANLNLYRGSITSNGAIDLYSTEVKPPTDSNVSNVTESLLSTYKVPLTAFSRPGLYPLDILSFDDTTWLAFVVGTTDPQLRVHGYRQERIGGAYNFIPLVDNNSTVAYPLKRLNEGWTLSTSPVPGDDKNPASSSSASFQEFNNINLTPICYDLGGSRSQCDQMLLSFGEKENSSPDASLHLLTVNVQADRTSRIGNSAAPAPVPLGAVINESKLRNSEYQTIPTGFAPQTFIKREEVRGYRVQVGGFGVGQEPEYDFISSFDEVPAHIRFARVDVLNPEPNTFYYFAQSQEDKSKPLVDAIAIDIEIKKLPVEEQFDVSKINVTLTEDIRSEYHIHWSAILRTSGNISAPYIEELGCDVPPNPTYTGYGLVDPSALPAN
jgi:hypothetical protein